MKTENMIQGGIVISRVSFNDGGIDGVTAVVKAETASLHRRRHRRCQGRDGLVTPSISKHRAKLPVRQMDRQLAAQTCFFVGQPSIFCISA